MASVRQFFEVVAGQLVDHHLGQLQTHVGLVRGCGSLALVPSNDVRNDCTSHFWSEFTLMPFVGLYGLPRRGWRTRCDWRRGGRCGIIWRRACAR